MSFQAGQVYVERIISLSRGEIAPENSVPEESIMYHLWKEIRKVDADAAEEILESTCAFWRAQADEKRKTLTDLASYLRFRATENGAEWVNYPV
jgi:aristolochene synthase